MTQPDQLPEFPARTVGNRLFATTCILRPAGLDDLAFLRQLYHSFRADELARVPWPPQDKQAFLNQQFDLQHRYYIAAFPQTDFLIIEKEGVRIGRLYIDLSADIWHIIDVGLLPEWRNRGIGLEMLNEIKAAAITRESLGIILHVDKANGRAQKLYQASGFEVIDATETHTRMQWLSRQVLPKTVDGRSGVN
ncbi:MULTISPECIES: GNAT family N-acetyltransferase [Rhizobium]|uniref:GNAT family N-acetyltransferase n=1 Tax=Rhizobium TaxID=379 RepID=UPI002477D3E8|nr:N-acetyltransferase [Rhizobium miluonense]